jgi:ABC-type dipeptide/oligopeptide/nickel transport system permease subunit
MELVQALTAESFATYSALGAALIIPTVEILRAHLLKNLQGVLVVALSVAVGAAYGALGSLVGFLDGGLASAAGFGAWAGVLASGANKYVDGLAKKS